MKVYLDTSVPSAYFDERTPERRSATVTFWPMLSVHDVYVSDLVVSEIEACEAESRRDDLIAVVSAFHRLDTHADQVSDLAAMYIALGVLPDAARADALHVAVAVVHCVDVVLSWNLRHLVRLRTRRGVNAINTLRGFGPIEILTPPEL